jgi:hypothetical protein
VTVTFTVSEPAELTCTLNGNPQSPCESGMVLDLADDEYNPGHHRRRSGGQRGTAMTIFTVDTSGRR